ncbi:MAG: hypothetical protein LBG93_01425 [Treponema sp.]|jgi:hypothetical protein|nr:hypothetical protein [Treponema sp.]
MNKRVNFEDSLFILSMRIRIIEDIITLDAEPNFFLEKTLDDIFFTDHLLRIILECLEENRHLIERQELLQQLSDFEAQFSRILHNFLEHDGNFSIRGFPSEEEKVALCRKNSADRHALIGKLSLSSGARSASPIVSSDEINELLKAF